jgi:hypothetical protein
MALTPNNLHALKQLLGRNAYYEEEDHIYYWYKVFSRKNRPKRWYDFVLRPLEVLILDKASGYFTKPGRVLLTKLAVLLTSFFVYLVSHTVFPKQIGTIINPGNAKFTEKLSFIQAISDIDALRDFLYFDIITYTTIGYGDIHPAGWLKLYAGLEGLIGVLLISLLLVTAAKKVLW